MSDLHILLSDGKVALAPLAEEHREPLRRLCEADRTIWEIYPHRMAGDDYDGIFDDKIANPQISAFAIIVDGGVAGTTSYLNVDRPNHALEIGATFLSVTLRGSGVNGRMKKLMIDHAIRCGFTRIEFRVDTRNQCSMAAVLKLGATQEGILRRNRVTWTGYVRDTAIFSILSDEWGTAG